MGTCRAAAKVECQTGDQEHQDFHQRGVGVVVDEGCQEPPKSRLLGQEAIDVPDVLDHRGMDPGSWMPWASRPTAKRMTSKPVTLNNVLMLSLEVPLYIVYPIHTARAKPRVPPTAENTGDSATLVADAQQIGQSRANLRAASLPGRSHWIERMYRNRPFFEVAALAVACVLAFVSRCVRHIES